jgi:nitrite reductase/ring-hydroxylating ferredoxin subunit
MSDGNWVTVASVDDVAEGDAIAVTVGERELALYHLEGGEFRCTDNVCTHEYARLTDGWFDGEVIECPLHAGQFDVRTGKGLCSPIERDLPVFEVKIADGSVLVKLPE